MSQYAISAKAETLGCADLSAPKPILRLKPSEDFTFPTAKDSKSFWSAKENRENYLSWLERKIGIKTPADWYSVNIDTFYKNKGTGAIRYYDYSVYKLLRDLRPALNLLAWKFPLVPKGFWNIAKNRRSYIEWLVKELNFEKKEDWYKLKNDDLKKNWGSGLLHRYESSMYKLMKDLFPEIDFLPWKFSMVPKGFWEVAENRKWYINWLGETLGYKRPEDWYQLTVKLVNYNYGGGLLKNMYDYSPSRLISENFPEYGLKPWLFGKTNSIFWKDSSNIREYINWLGSKLGYQKLDDWYSVQTADFKRFSGGGLIDLYTPRELLAIAYPNNNWMPWKFKQLAQNYWSVKENRDEYLLWLAEQLGYKKQEDWYGVTNSDFQRNFGGGILDFYKNDRIRVLQDVDPTFDWQFWRFRVPLRRNLWTEENKSKFVDHMAKELGIVVFEDWYEVTQKDFASAGGGGLLMTIYQGSPAKALMDLMPNENWRPELFDKKSKSQQRMFQLLGQIFPGEEIIYNFRSEEVRFSNSNRKMEIDVFLPGLKLGFEYQGEQHYMSIEYWGGEASLSAIRARDAEKISAFAESGITIIEVPYTWNRTRDGLESLINDSKSGKIGGKEDLELLFQIAN